MNKPSFKERFLYWFDNQMSKGSMTLIRLLTFTTLFAIIFLSLIGCLLGADEGAAATFWDTFAAIINAWMPSYGDYESGIGYLIVMAIAGIIGLLLTSVLIGIISNAIEEKINSLKHGNSKILENGHIVVLGFTPGEYTLINQLILAAAGRERCIVIGEEMDREEMEENIRDNVDIPKNIRVIFRTIDIFDPVSLEKLSLTTAKNIIISPADDQSTAKALLAVSLNINSSKSNVKVGAIVSQDEYVFPESMAKKHNVTTLQTNETLAKIIAHSCTQSGISDTFREIFNFEGSELYTIRMENTIGKNFEELMCCMDKGIPVGIVKKGKVYINPSSDTTVEKNDELIVFSETESSAILTEMPNLEDLPVKYSHTHHSPDAGQVVILGYNSSFKTVFQELPEYVRNVMIGDFGEENRNEILKIVSSRPEINFEFFEEDISDFESLIPIAKIAHHIVLLNDETMDEESADLKIIFRILNLRDLRERLIVRFNITAEMRKEKNQFLVDGNDRIDFVVASNMSSLFLAQFAESPELDQVFKELLSNEGCEFYLKRAREVHCMGKHTILDLRRICLKQGYILLGYKKQSDNISVFNPDLNNEVELIDLDRLIVIGED